MAAPRNDNVKEKILDAATGLLDTQTFADISLAEIAAAAGVSKGTLYYYYKNKTDILFDRCRKGRKGACCDNHRGELPLRRP